MAPKSLFVRASSQGGWDAEAVLPPLCVYACCNLAADVVLGIAGLVGEMSG
jgi:hypothetical protein